MVCESVGEGVLSVALVTWVTWVHVVHTGSKFSDEELSDYITVNPEFDHKNVTQALLIPGLEDPQFFNYDTPETMDEEVALHVLMMVTIAVDPHYQSSIKKIAAPFVKGIVNGFQSAPPKSFSRAHNKTSSPDDYRFKSKPRSQHNIDVSRNLVRACVRACTAGAITVNSHWGQNEASL